LDHILVGDILRHFGLDSVAVLEDECMIWETRLTYRSVEESYLIVIRQKILRHFGLDSVAVFEDECICETRLTYRSVEESYLIVIRQKILRHWFGLCGCVGGGTYDLRDEADVLIG